MLSVDDLCKPMIARSNMNHETYKMLYTQCIDHIKRKHESGCTITIFNVPGFVLGRPIFTHTHAVRYVAEKLCRGKFDVKVDGPLIYVDWEARIKEACRKESKMRMKTRRVPSYTKPCSVRSNAPSSQSLEPLSVRLERLLKK